VKGRFERRFGEKGRDACPDGCRGADASNDTERARRKERVDKTLVLILKTAKKISDNCGLARLSLRARKQLFSLSCSGLSLW
jgi:hypothetical protein